MPRSSEKHSAESHDDHYSRAKQWMPGGVNSSTRLNRALGIPVYARSAYGSKVVGIDGCEFIDMCCSHGAGLLGYGHPAVEDAVSTAMSLGFVHAFETGYHAELARRVCSLVPCAERVRFCSSGSEATMHLIRACRAYTGRTKIIRFEGHFHGYHELIYIGGHPPRHALGSDGARPYIESPGIPESFADHIISLPFNDFAAFDAAVDRFGSETAIVILEPVNFNCAGIKPVPGYLEHLRKVTRDAGIVLFFDEIQSSFKKSAGGAQFDLGVTPDVSTIGKSLGGGFPLSAFCGCAEIMDLYQPAGPVQHSGTFNAHIVPVLAGLAFLDVVESPGFYERLRELEFRFHHGLDSIIAALGLPMIAPRHGARFNLLLGRTTPAVRYEDTFCHDNSLMLSLIRECWKRGVYFHDYGGGPLHHGFSIQHSENDIDTVLGVLGESLEALRDDFRRSADETI